jgi:hypothetical protein
MPFSRRYELERLKKNCRLKSPHQKFREVVDCGSPLPLFLRQWDERENCLYQPSLKAPGNWRSPLHTAH